MVFYVQLPLKCVDLDFDIFQSVSVNKGGDVEIIRYQVLIPVTDVQVRTIAKEGEEHFLWELVHMRCHPQRRSERVYLLSNR